MALLRHSGIYFLARFVAGSASFAIIAVYTRLLSAQEFGELALLLAGVGFCGQLLGDTPTSALLRFLPDHAAAARATLLWGLILPAAAICVLAMAGFAIAAPAHWRLPFIIATALVLVTLLHKFQLATAQGALNPGQYALLGGIESILDMVLGIALVWAGYGVAGALAGTTLGIAFTLILNWRGWWIGRASYDPGLARRMLRFGAPLIASALCLWLATFADRWLIGGIAGTGEAGLYAAAYDLQMNLLGMPMMVMQLAGYPLTIAALSERGPQAARQQLLQVGAFIVLLILPEAVGIVMTGPLLTSIFIGPSFRPLSMSLLPLLVSATLLKVLMIYLCYRYFLSGRTHLTLASYLTAAVVDILLNLILLPHYGAWGAGIAALAGFGAGFATAVIATRGVFSFPLPAPAIVAAGLAGVAAMTAWLWPFRETTVWTSALYIIPVAVLIYFGALFLFLHLAGQNPLGLLRDWWSGGSRTIG